MANAPKRLTLTEEERAAFRKAGAYGRALQLATQPTFTACTECGTPYGEARHQRYCSNACALKASRRRRKEAAQRQEGTAA